MRPFDEALAAAAIPPRLLGLGCESWTKGDIWRILDHYGVPRGLPITLYSKLDLLAMLSKLAQKRGLEAKDRYKILKCPCYRGLVALGLIKLPQGGPAIKNADASAAAPSLASQNGRLDSPISNYPAKTMAEAHAWLGTNRVRRIERAARHSSGRRRLREATSLLELDVIVSQILDPTTPLGPMLCPKSPLRTIPSISWERKVVPIPSKSPLPVVADPSGGFDPLATTATPTLDDQDTPNGAPFGSGSNGQDMIRVLPSTTPQGGHPKLGVRAVSSKAIIDAQPRKVFKSRRKSKRTLESMIAEAEGVLAKRRRLSSAEAIPCSTWAATTASSLANISGPLPTATAINQTHKSIAVCTAPTCVVCFEALNTATTPIRRIASSCDHEPLICTACLAQSITSQLESKIWNQIGCPMCNVGLSYEDVQVFASKAAFERYDNLATLEAMSALPHFRRCLAAGCESGQIHFEGAAQPIMTCVACRRKTCYIHEMEWHEGRTCEKIDEQTAEAKKAEKEANEAYLAANTKTCPKEKCGRPIEKNGGCQHMTCSQCRHQFCWDCLAPWKQIAREGNEAHAETCRWYSQNLEPHPADVAEIARIERERAALAMPPNAGPAATPAPVSEADEADGPPVATPAQDPARPSQGSVLHDAFVNPPARNLTTVRANEAPYDMRFLWGDPMFTFHT